jgi:hypothetical protein
MLATADYTCSSSNYICSFSQSTRMCGYGPAAQRCLHTTQRIRPGGAYSSVRNDSAAAVYSSRGLQPRSTAATVYSRGIQPRSTAAVYNRHGLQPRYTAATVYSRSLQPPRSTAAVYNSHGLQPPRSTAAVYSRGLQHPRSTPAVYSRVSQRLQLRGLHALLWRVGASSRRRRLLACLRGARTPA